MKSLCVFLLVIVAVVCGVIGVLGAAQEVGRKSQKTLTTQVVVMRSAEATLRTSSYTVCHQRDGNVIKLIGVWGGPCDHLRVTIRQHPRQHEFWEVQKAVVIPAWE